jgi:hypothetical protein
MMVAIKKLILAREELVETAEQLFKEGYVNLRILFHGDTIELRAWRRRVGKLDRGPSAETQRPELKRLPG